MEGTGFLDYSFQEAYTLSETLTLDYMWSRNKLSFG